MDDLSKISSEHYFEVFYSQNGLILYESYIVFTLSICYFQLLIIFSGSVQIVKEKYLTNEVYNFEKYTERPRIMQSYQNPSFTIHSQFI